MGFPPGSSTPREYYIKSKPFHQPIGQTHSLAEDVLYGKIKGLFTFRDPVEAVISTRHQRWESNHFANCGVYNRKPEECDNYTEDVLGYEKIFDSWTTDHGYPIMLIKYETMDKHFKEIAGWVGRDIQFNPWRIAKSNKSKVTQEQLASIEKTYANLIDKVNKMPEISYIGVHG